MPKLEIQQSHNLPLAEVKQRLQDLQNKMAEKYGISGTWISEREASVKRTCVTGKITCDENNVRIFLDLSFALAPLKGKIEDRIRQALRDTLA
jgi:putative polyhydroxyalkanoate system protein